MSSRARFTGQDRMERTQLFVAMAVPVLYYAGLLVGGLLYPGYSHVTQYASELGSASARYPLVFNVAIISAGIAELIGAGGFYVALKRLRMPWLATLLAIVVAAQGAGFVFGGLFPMPDERHGGYGLGLASVFGPCLATAIMWRGPVQLRSFRLLFALNTVAVVVMLAIMMGVGQQVTTANVGVYQRIFSLTSIPWVGVLSFVLFRLRSGRPGGHPRSAGSPGQAVSRPVE